MDNDLCLLVVCDGKYLDKKSMVEGDGLEDDDHVSKPCQQLLFFVSQPAKD